MSAAAFDISEIVYTIAFAIDDFRALDAFTCVSRRCALTVGANRPAIYAAHTEISLQTTTYAGSFIRHRVYGLLHSLDDQPAVLASRELEDVQVDYFMRGDSSLPNETYIGYTRTWYYRNRRHRGNDSPALMCGTFQREWYCHGEYHRDGDMPAITWGNGLKAWYRRGVKYYPRQ